MTRITLIKRALRMLGVLAPGESLPDAEHQDAAVVLQGMLGQWATSGLTMFATVEEIFALVADQASYTVGDGGNVDIDRPTFVEQASIISVLDPTKPVEQEIEVIRTSQRWQEVALKSATGGWPEAVYHQTSFPLARLWPYPIPDIGTLQMKLYIRQRVTGFTSAVTDYTFPDGYEDALAFNLAKRLAPEWGVDVPTVVAEQATITFTNIKRVNQRPPELRINQAVYGSRSARGAYDIRTDE